MRSGRLRSRSLALLVLASLGSAVGRAEVFATMGSRALGMGGAFVAVATDGTAVHYNPAGVFLEPALQESLVGAVSETEADDFASHAGDLSGVAFQDPAVYNDADARAAIASALRKLAKEGSGDYGVTAFGSFGGKQVHSVSLTTTSYGHAWADVDLTHVGPGTDPATSLPFNESQLVSSGVEMRELIYTFSHSIFSNAFVVGLNVKYIDARTYYRTQSAFSSATPGSPSDFIDTAFDEGREKDSAFTADLGVMYLLSPTTKLGVVGKYLAPVKLAWAGPGGEIKIDPQLRAGLSHTWGLFVTGAIDVDLTDNETGIPGLTERQAAAGVEWWVGKKRDFALRGGVNDNLSGGGTTPGLALGFGYRAPHFMADVGVELVNPDETKYAFNFTFRR